MDFSNQRSQNSSGDSKDKKRKGTTPSPSPSRSESSRKRGARQKLAGKAIKLGQQQVAAVNGGIFKQTSDLSTPGLSPELQTKQNSKDESRRKKSQKQAYAPPLMEIGEQRRLSQLPLQMKKNFRSYEAKAKDEHQANEFERSMQMRQQTLRLQQSKSSKNKIVKKMKKLNSEDSQKSNSLIELMNIPKPRRTQPPTYLAINNQQDKSEKYRNPAASKRRKQFMSTSKVQSNAKKDLETILGNFQQMNSKTNNAFSPLLRKNENSLRELQRQSDSQSRLQNLRESIGEQSAQELQQQLQQDQKQFITKDEYMKNYSLPQGGGNNSGLGSEMKSFNLSSKQQRALLQQQQMADQQSDRDGHFSQLHSPANIAKKEKGSVGWENRRASRRIDKAFGSYFLDGPLEALDKNNKEGGGGFRLLSTNELRTKKQPSDIPLINIECLSPMSKAQAEKQKNLRNNNNTSQIGESSSPSGSKSRFDQTANGNKKISKKGRALQRSNTEWSGQPKQKRQVNRINSVEQASRPPTTEKSGGGMISQLFRMFTQRGSAVEEKKPDEMTGGIAAVAIYSRQNSQNSKKQAKNELEEIVEDDENETQKVINKDIQVQSSESREGQDSCRINLIDVSNLRSERSSDNQSRIIGSQYENVQDTVSANFSIFPKEVDQEQQGPPEQVDFSRDSNEEHDKIDQDRESPNEFNHRPVQGQEYHAQISNPDNTYNHKQLDTAKSNEFIEDDDNDKRQDLNRKKVLQAFLCYPEDRVKHVWDIFTSAVLIMACFITPFSLAFELIDEETQTAMFYFGDTWGALESFIDIVFIVEIIVCFNTSVYDQQTNEYITKRCQIAKIYLCGWFCVDFMAILPRLLLSVGNWAKILSFMKIARIGRLIKLLRILKMAKVIKQKVLLQKQMQTKMRLSVAKERLFIFSIFAILFVHTISCLWIFLGVYHMDDDGKDNWIDKFDFNIKDMGEMYTIGLYWTITTITTVGYGDISATNTSERLVACIIMVIGVIAFSFSTGSLSSIIQNVDSRQAVYRQKLNVLKELRMTYGIDDNLYMELNAFINFQSSQRHQERDTFINELPDRLKYRVSKLLYAEYSKKIIFFRKVKDNTNFIAWVCPNLKPLEVIQDALIQVEQEKLTCINFIRIGEVAYVSPRYCDYPYLVCSEGDSFGILDIIFRRREIQQRNMMKKEQRRQLRQERQMQKYGQSDYDSISQSSDDSSPEEEDFAVMSSKIKCKFTIKARVTCYLLQMQKSALQKMHIEFPEIFTRMLADEMQICIHAIDAKAKLIDYLEQERKHGMLSSQISPETIKARMNSREINENDDGLEYEESQSQESVPDEPSQNQESQQTPQQQEEPSHKGKGKNKNIVINVTPVGSNTYKKQKSKPEQESSEPDHGFEPKQALKQRSYSQKLTWKGPATMDELRLRDIKEESSHDSSFQTSSMDSQSQSEDEGGKPQVQILGESGTFDRESLSKRSFILLDYDRQSQKRKTHAPSPAQCEKIDMDACSANSHRSLTVKDEMRQSQILKNTLVPPKSKQRMDSKLLSAKRQKSDDEESQNSTPRGTISACSFAAQSEQNRSQSARSLNMKQVSKRNSNRLPSNNQQQLAADALVATPLKQSGRSSSVQNSNKSNKSVSALPPVENLKKTMSNTDYKKDKQNRANRFEQYRDEDDRLVMQGFRQMVKSNKAEKYAKNLVRTTTKRDIKVHRLSNQLRQANSNNMRLAHKHSHNPDPLIHGRSGKSNLTGKAELRYNDELEQHFSKLDRMLLDNQSSGMAAPNHVMTSPSVKIDMPRKSSHSPSPEPHWKDRINDESRANALKQHTQEIPSQNTQESHNLQIKPDPVLNTTKSMETSKKSHRLESLIEATSTIQKTILEKIVEMRDEVGTVKADQERLIRKSNQIRSGHRKILSLTNSEASSRGNQSALVKNSGHLKPRHTQHYHRSSRNGKSIRSKHSMLSASEQQPNLRFEQPLALRDRSQRSRSCASRKNQQSSSSQASPAANSSHMPLSSARGSIKVEKWNLDQQVSLEPDKLFLNSEEKLLAKNLVTDNFYTNSVQSLQRAVRQEDDEEAKDDPTHRQQSTHQ